ncbi:unnamed protein product [Rotaria socialis]|uniref:Uncharacterized protein n=1 Tax=Rotaria socialis TaxID=392032 RepID=A0A820QJJ4_9BILA|nr:unnamed protein product [Rotaria socialis]CAF4423734.1 unnamed protein product [Rotaria socialis]
MVQSVASSSPSFILSTYGSNNKATATDVLKRWLYIYNQFLRQGARAIGFSSDCDARYLRAMRLCTRFFAQLPNLNLVKQKDDFHLQILERWSWFFYEWTTNFTFHARSYSCCDQNRALSGPYSSITNSTVKSFTKKCEKISIINSIKSRGGQIGEYHFKFPQHHKLEKETEAHNYSINPIQQLNLTEFDIEKIIQSAFESAKQNIEIVNMTQLLKNEHRYSISELSQYIKTNISKSSSKVIDYTKGFDFDDESDEDNLQDDENNSSMSDDIY